MNQGTKTRIAVVEDENSLRNDLVEYLQLREFATSGFATAEALYQTWHENPYDLVILDIGLPGDSGLQAAHWLRANSSTGIVMLTAWGSVSDQVIGLETGADAYLVKNATLEVVAATCRSVLRRLVANVSSATSEKRTTSPSTPVWRLNIKSWQLALPTGEKFALTHTETLFLQCLLQQSGKPISRAELLTALNKADTLANQRNLDNCPSRLRRKISNEYSMDIPIRPSYGNGYTFAAEGEIDGV